MTTTGGGPGGPFDAVGGLAVPGGLPDLLRVRQEFHAPVEADIPAAVARELDRLADRVRPGMRVAVTAGSRGIHDLPAVLAAAGEWLRGRGAQPYVVPAMGSHGGATAEGQLTLLAELGVTEATVAMPLRATMDTVELPPLADGPRVHLDAYAAEADAILAVNRVKPHTDFRGPVESGLAKIVAIGLGKRNGAEEIHSFGPAALARWIPAAARRIAATGKLLGGLAIVENAYDRAAIIAGLTGEEIAGPAEEKLLEQARSLMATLPFEEFDVLVVDAMGKDKSGCGMDTNVIGRMMIRGCPEFERPRIATIAVLDLTAASHGNAVGVGLADFTTARLMSKVDLYNTYVNALTAGLAGVQRGQLPIVLPTDRDAVAAAVRTCGRPDPAAVRLVRIRDTLDLSELQVSTALAGEVAGHPRLTGLGAPAPAAVDADGALAAW